MNSPRPVPVGLSEQTSSRVVLRYRSDDLSVERAASLVAQADRIVRYVERRLAPLLEEPRGSEPLILTVVVDRSPAFDEPEQVALGADGPADDVGARIALLALERRIGGPELWRGRGATAVSTARIEAIAIGTSVTPARASMPAGFSTRSLGIG